MVYPSCTHLKLWADALRRLGKNPTAYPRVSSHLEKYRLPLKEGFCADPRPVHQVYELTTHNSREFEIIPLHGVDKHAVLITHTYRLQFLEGPLRKKLHFEQCGRAARHFAISRIIRPSWPFLLKELVNLVKKELV